MKNANMEIGFNEAGCLTKLVLADDNRHMNWIMDPAYLEEVGYENSDKYFGKFEIVVEGERYTSHNARNHKIETYGNVTKVSYKFHGFEVNFKYDLGKSECSHDMIFKVTVKNKSDRFLIVEDFRVWTAFAYIMYQDTDVIRNMEQSCAVFQSISHDYTKIALFRRSNKGPHLGMYQLRGETKSVGTYCDFTNLFFENVSPSLDGVIFYQLVLAGGYVGSREPQSDWIYNREAVKIEPGEKIKWSYGLCEFKDKDDFYNIGLQIGHPQVEFNPMTLVGKTIEADATLPERKKLERVDVLHFDGEVITQTYDGFDATFKQHLSLPVNETGEHKVNLILSDGTVDSFIVNVMDPLPELLENRAEYICNVLYQGPDGKTPYCFSPVSNQGESLGKLNNVLKTNLLDKVNRDQVRKVEASAVNYIKPKWFEGGDLTKPVKLYGDFYRIFDLEYIAHTFYLLSKFSDEDLALNSAHTYYEWAKQVFELRLDPNMHELERGKKETQLCGMVCLYAADLLADIKQNENAETYEKFKKLWNALIQHADDEASLYKGAITELFYDNAGFGPAAAALAGEGRTTGAKKYADLLEANIGFANDFRAQNPDRWWEALSYMIHGLWGGICAACMLKVYERSGDYRHLEAAYRSTVAMLYCYDTNATATDLKLAKGEAASTYSTSGPLINLPKLSRNRFGQSVFAELGGIYADLFKNNDSTMDWDMGEQLAAYLDGFGIKTFVYEKNGQVCVANGAIREVEDGYEIESYAPYPSQYHFIERDLHYICPQGKTESKVLLTKYGFESAI